VFLLFFFLRFLLDYFRRLFSKEFIFSTLFFSKLNCFPCSYLIRIRFDEDDGWRTAAITVVFNFSLGNIFEENLRNIARNSIIE